MLSIAKRLLAFSMAVATTVAVQAQARDFSPPAPPDFARPTPTSIELAELCDPSGSGIPRLEALAYCEGFLTSFSQQHALALPRSGSTVPLFCIPATAPGIPTSGSAFAEWARDHRDRPDEAALDGVLRWAQASFPCLASSVMQVSGSPPSR